MFQQPRPVQFKTMFSLLRKKPVHLILGIFFSMFAVFFFSTVLMIFSAEPKDMTDEEYEKINAQGNLAMAAVTKMEEDAHVTVNDRHPVIISYKYVANGSTVVSEFKTFSLSQAEQFSMGDSIEIKYLGEQSIIPSLELFRFPVEIFYAVPGIFLIVGLSCLAFVMYKVKGELNLYKFGVVTDAEVVGMSHKAGTGISRLVQGVEVQYQYTAQNGRTYLGESFSADVSLLNTLKHGDRVKIFVSPEDQSKSILIPRVEALRNNWQIV